MAHNVIADGPGLYGGIVGQFNDVLIERDQFSRAGRLSTEFEGPSRVIIKFIDNHDSTVKLSYKPTLPGNYVIFLKYNGLHLPGSPFRVQAVDPSTFDMEGNEDDNCIKSSVASSRFAVLCTSADFMWITKSSVNLPAHLNDVKPTENSFEKSVNCITEAAK